MKILLSTLLAALCISASAEVLVYKSSATATTTGLGTLKKEKSGGFTVLDTDTADVCDVVSNPLLKTFYVNFPENYSISTIYGPAKSYTVFALATDTPTASGLDFAKGMNTSFLANGKGLVAPKSFTTQSRGVFWEPDRFLEYAGKSALDSKRTATYDLAGMDFEDVVEALANYLIGQGYTEEFSRPATTAVTVTMAQAPPPARATLDALASELRLRGGKKIAPRTAAGDITGRKRAVPESEKPGAQLTP